ncbi:ATP-binding protein [Faecalicatena contorta]|nr:ATP-binding protein [Faecalicatena contorta]
MGLALAYRVVDKLGGELEVTSEPGKGSIFTATIPLNY